MRTRHEQLQAYRFVTRRIISAMLSGEPETAELPMRRLGMTFVGSLVISAIVLAGVGIYGFINPSGGEPEENDIIVMRETGARFVYIDGYLHPVLNFTSAQLIVGSDASPRTMSRNSLEDIPRGRPVGIENAPDPAPSAESLLDLPWSVCAAQSAETTTTTTQVRVGSAPLDGTALGDQAILVTTSSTGDLPMYLLVDDVRLRISDWTVLTALELASVTPVRVSTQLLNSVPAGPDLAAVVLSNEGETSATTVAGTSGDIGGVYRSGQQHYILTETGLAPVGDVMAALLTAGGEQVTAISAQQAAEALSSDQVEPDGFPSTMPTVLSGNDVEVCAVYRTDVAASDQATSNRTVSIELFSAGQGVADTDEQSVALTGAQDSSTADQVLVPEGKGALVRILPEPGVDAETTLYLITDQGLSFPLAEGSSVSARDALGYSDVTPLAIPASILGLIPSGPVLDPDAARNFLEQTVTSETGDTAETAASPTPTATATTSAKASASAGASASASPSSTGDSD